MLTLLACDPNLSDGPTGDIDNDGILNNADNAITVNSTADPGDGICNPMECTLREAIVAANTNANTDTITFDIAGAGPHTIQLTEALPDLSSDMNINGPVDESVEVRGEGAADPKPYRIFTIAAATVDISRLTISNGMVRGTNNTSGDGAPGLGGGIANEGSTLTLTHCIISGNSATGGNGSAQGGAANGGAIYSSGPLTVSNLYLQPELRHGW